MGSSKEDDEAGGASGGKSKPGVATVENGTPAADSPNLKNIDQDGVSDGSQNPSGNDYVQGALASSYAMSQQSSSASKNDSMFFIDDDENHSTVVHYVGSSTNQIVTLELIRNSETGETQLATKNTMLTSFKYSLVSKFKHQNMTIIRLKNTKEPYDYINVSEEEFKRNFSNFNKSQLSQLPNVKGLREREWTDDSIAGKLLTNLQERGVRPKTDSRFQLRSPYFTGQQAYFTGQQAYFLRRGYSGW